MEGFKLIEVTEQPTKAYTLSDPYYGKATLIRPLKRRIYDFVKSAKQQGMTQNEARAALDHFWDKEN